jgi:hypothetical protein
MANNKFNLSVVVFYSVIIAMILILPYMAFATPVPDTGQMQSYTDTFGEDSDYTCNPHSYTDLANGIVRDNVTGLEWQQATAPGTYTWQQAVDYCNNLILGGYADWRLPDIKELSALVDSSIPYPGPTINTSYFPDTVASLYWSSTTYATNANNAWLVYFYDGLVNGNGKLSYYYVRAVRGGQVDNSFIDNGNGTITDASTGLMWQQVTAPSSPEELTPTGRYGRYTWEQALMYCENLTLAGHSDWRLPNRNELQSIVDYSRYNPAIDTTFFPDTVAAPYWSSTTRANDTSGAWYVSFYDGLVSIYSKYNDIYVRAVRGGQCGTTVINLSSFTATPKAGKVILQWKTESEIDNAGFNLYRSEAENGEYIKINSSLIPTKGSSTQGASYEFTDNNVQNRKTYYYKLEDIDTNGISTFHGPVKAVPRWWK